MDDIASNVDDLAVATEIDFSLLSGANATFIAEMNKAWRDNPSSVDRHWAAYFEQLGKAADFGAGYRSWP
jgi:2-oxoglutarate dehydrogenase complex dehydrogenase (E1) component-like enzyme